MIGGEINNIPFEMVLSDELYENCVLYNKLCKNPYCYEDRKDHKNIIYKYKKKK